MDTLRQSLRRAMEGYAGRALNGYSYLLGSPDMSVFAIVSVGHVQDRDIVDTGLMARVAGERIIIERDVNDKPLVDALIAEGIDRSRITLKYAGESAEEAA